MILSTSARELLDRYLLGVRRSLYGKKREQAALEIEASILERIEKRHPGMEEAGDPELLEVLQEMGAPGRAALSHAPGRSLIGQELFPSYLLVLKIVVPVVLGAITLAFVVEVILGEQQLLWLLFIPKYLASLWNAAFMAGAWVTLVFALIERFGREKAIEELKDFGTFKLEDLPELSKPEKQVSRVGLIFEIGLGLLGMAFLTYLITSDGAFPIYMTPQAIVGEVKIFTENFLRFVPIMMAIAGLELSRTAIVLIQGRHDLLTTSLRIVAKCADILLAAVLLGAFPLVRLDWLQPFSDEGSWNMAQIQRWVDIVIRAILLLSIFGSVVEIIKRLVNYFKLPEKIEGVE